MDGDDDDDDKVDTDCWFSFWNAGIIFHCGGTQDISLRKDERLGQVKSH